MSTAGEVEVAHEALDAVGIPSGNLAERTLTMIGRFASRLGAGRSRREWVVGFAFDESAEVVVLIRKARPEWQAGRLNGVGGKVEPDVDVVDGAVSIVAAMTREFAEETGVRTGREEWQHFASLKWEEGTVHFFRLFDWRVVRDSRTLTDEPIEVHRVAELDRARVTPNLRWLVPLAAHRHDSYDVIDVVETGTTMRKPGRLEVLPGSPLSPAEG